jgi:hypothetical protein
VIWNYLIDSDLRKSLAFACEGFGSRGKLDETAHNPEKNQGVFFTRIRTAEVRVWGVVVGVVAEWESQRIGALTGGQGAE